MSVIQALREKYATTVVIVVCISLVAFLLMDAFVGPKSFFKKGTDVVTVDGVAYSYKSYMQDVKQAENNYRRQNPDATMTDEVRSQIKKQVYQRFVQRQILETEYDKLGIAFSTDELRSLTITADASPRIKQIPGFKNPQTGQFDPNRVISFIENVKNAPANNRQAVQQRQQWMQMEKMLRNSALLTKYTSLINNGIYIPGWLSKEKLKEQHSFSNITYVSAAYTSIPDSAVHITDQDLNSYLGKHKNQYHIDASRAIEYVAFDVVPSSKDSANIFDRMSKLKAELDTIDNKQISGFISRNSETPYLDRYIPKSMIQSSAKDELLDLPVGDIYGPYFDGNKVVYAKNLGTKSVFDTARIQQLLISTQQVPDSVAQFKADSIRTVVKNGANFTRVINTYTQGQAQNNGLIQITPDNPNIPDKFIQFVTDHHAGDLSVVKSQYGYHIIKLINKKNIEKGYKLVYLSTPMDASQGTDQAIYSEANKFRGLNTTRKAFEATAKEKGLTIQNANSLDADTYKINDLSSSRDIVHWAFNAEKNDVSKVFILPDSYVIAVLTDITPEGVAPLETVRPEIQAVVRRKKKANSIADKYKNKSTLQAIASALGDTMSVGNRISFVTSFIPNSGFEPKVVGASFHKDWTNSLSKPVFGNNGVYYLKVDSLYHTESIDSTSVQAMKAQLNNRTRRQIGSQLRDVLMKESDIDDQRLSFPGI